MACPPLLSDIARSTLWYNVADAAAVLRLLGRGHLQAQGRYGLLAFLSESCNGRPNCTCLICALQRKAPCSSKQTGPAAECRCINCRVFRQDGTAHAESNNRRRVLLFTQRGFESRPHEESLLVLSFGTRSGFGCAAVGLNLGLWKRQTFYDQLCGGGSLRRNRTALAETATAMFGRRREARLCALISAPIDSDCDCALCRKYSEQGPLQLLLPHTESGKEEGEKPEEEKEERRLHKNVELARNLRVLARLRQASGCSNLWQIQVRAATATVVDDLSYYGAKRTLQFLSGLAAMAARAGPADPVLEREIGPLVPYGKQRGTGRFYLLVSGERREQEYEALISRGLEVVRVTTLDAPAVADWSTNPSIYLRRSFPSSGRERVVLDMVNRVTEQGGGAAAAGLDFSLEPSFLVFKCSRLVRESLAS